MAAIAECAILSQNLYGRERSGAVLTKMAAQQELIVERMNAIGAMTKVAVYAFVRVVPRTRVNRETRTVDVTFIVQEGPKVFVERIAEVR